MNTKITIDGTVYDIPCRIIRTAEVKASEISGLLINGVYFNDVVGVYMEYDVDITTPLYMQGKYAQLYEKLTEPVDAHTFILPYNQSTITLTARVESVEDEFEELPGGTKYWKNPGFTIIANHPSKSETLSEVITRGRCPIPEITGPREGDTYTYTNGAWVKVEDEGE